MVNSITKTFTGQNRERTYTVPTNAASIQIEAIGGEGYDRTDTGEPGGNVWGIEQGTAGGKGGYVQATLSVNGGDTATIHIGKNATTSRQNPTPSTYGSYAEGEIGDGGNKHEYSNSRYTPAGGEGGSGTVITINGSRKVIAGGGGGGATGDAYTDKYGPGADGGAGGTPYGGAGGTGKNNDTNTSLTAGNDGSGYAVSSAKNVTTGSSSNNPKVTITAFLPPDRITDISSSAKSPNEIEVYWNQPSNNGTLYLYRYNNNPKNASQIASFNASNSSYNDNSVNHNQTYGYYLVQEYKEATQESKATVSATPSDIIKVYDGNQWQYTNGLNQL